MGISDLADDELGEDEDEVQEAEIIDVSDEEGQAPAPSADNALLQPVADAKEIADVYNKFEEIKSEILTNDDTETHNDRPFITKSGWRKIATAFNLSVETVQEEIVVEDSVVKARVKAKATAPNGKVATGRGICASSELRFTKTGKPPENKEDDPDWHQYETQSKTQWRKLRDPRIVSEHDLVATAATRAKNRAISDCVGGGEVSAEEVRKSKEDIFG